MHKKPPHRLAEEQEVRIAAELKKQPHVPSLDELMSRNLAGSARPRLGPPRPATSMISSTPSLHTQSLQLTSS
jgi:hypothetical protein